MNDSTLKETTVGDVLTVARELCHALMDARRYVAVHAALDAGYATPGLESRAVLLLDQIDGALADAGEILGGRTL